MTKVELTEEIIEAKVTQIKNTMFNLNVMFLTLCVVFQVLFQSTIVNAEEPVVETIKVVQVGTSGGIPAIQASVQNASDTGTYSIVISNPKTKTTFSQQLNSSGKEVTFAITNFTENGTYPYSLQVNGLDLLEGGVNLVSTKRTPSFVVQLRGTDLTVDITGGVDFSGQTIFFKSGSYSNSLTLSGDSVQRAFSKAEGLESKMTFSTEKGDLATVDIKNLTVSGSGGETIPPATSPVTKPPTGSGGNVTVSPTNPPPVTVPPQTKPDINTGTVNNGANPPLTTQQPNTNSGSQKKISVVLNQKTFELEETIVARVDVINTDYAGRAITLRLGADDNSTVALLNLDNMGKASHTFKILVPQPSSKVISATTYSIGGSQLDSSSIKYAITNEVKGVKTKGDGDFAADVPHAEYVSLDLSNLDKQKAVLAWYGAKNISKYATKLKVTNTTTNDEHIYAVFVPDGDSKINLNLVYDGPGIYTWSLHSGGRLVAQAPYSTPLGVDGITAVSQNGLPVLKTLANKDVYLSNLEGTDPNAVSGSTIGEPIGGVAADDITGQDLVEPFNPEQQQSNKKKYMLIGLVVFILILGIVGFLLYRRKKMLEEEPTSNGFVKYNGEEKEESDSGDSEDFKEVD